MLHPPNGRTALCTYRAMDLVRLTAHAFGVPACHLPHQHTNPARGDCGRFVSDRHVALTIPARDVTTGATPRAATKRSATGKKAPTSASTAVAVVERIEDRELHEEAKISYLAYAMSVVVDRALPDVRDGLKPVHRRILYAMHDLGLSPTKPFKKCARIVGEVLGKYHPHGDQSVYNALVRLAQDFSMREPLISGHGNFGSLDDDPAAAMRYTECRLRPLTVDALMSDLEDGTVDFAPTFDGSQTEPSVLPARVPLLLINGAMGIAVGMATNIPPHNMREVVAALRALIAKPDITVNQLMAYVPAPDFPTGGEIVVTPSIADAYRTGSGSTVIRGAVTIENPTGGGTNGETNGTKPIRRAKATATSGSGSDEAGTSGSGSGSSSDDADGNGGSRRRSLLVISEIPYGVNKSELVSRIAELTEDKTLDGVADVRDESDRTGTRVVVEVRRGHDAQVVLNQVFKHTRLQTRFGTNITALVDGSPQELNLLQCLQHFLDFRVRVVERRARFYLSAAQARLHLVEGFLLTTRRSNEVVQTIRSAADSATASTALQSSFGLSHVQAQAVLALPLRRLAGQEQTKLEQEEKELQARVADLQALLANRGRVRELVGQEAQEVADKHGNPRRTALVGMQEAKVDLVHEDLTPNRQSFIMWSRRNFIKRVDADFFEQQQRGGKGKMGGRLRANDALEEVVAVHDHDQVLLVSEDGRGFPLKAYDIPDASRASGGTAIAQLIRTTENVPIAAMLSIPALPPRGAAAAASAAAAAAASASNDAPADDDEGGGGALDASDPAAGLSLVMVTTAGSIKRVALADARSNRKLGITLFKVPEGDRVGWAAQCREDDVVLVASSQARVLLFPASSITQRQRSSGSVLGMRLPKGQRVVSMCMLPAAIAERISSSDEDDDGAADGDECVTTSDDEAEFTPAPGCEEPAGPWVLTISNLGYGKRTLMTDMRVMSRGCKGSLGHRLRKGEHLAAVHVLLSLQDEVVMASDKGLLVKISADAVPLRRRVSSGNKLMNMGANSQLQTVTVVRKSDVA